MKTIAIFSAYYYPHLGGIERYIDNLIKQFSKMKYKVILVTSNYNNEEQYEKKDEMVVYRLPVYNLFKNRYPIIKHNKQFNDIIDQLDEYEIDSIIVNTRFHLTSHIGAKYGKKRGISVYLIEHGSNYVTLDNKFIDFFANIYEKFLTWKIKPNIKEFYGVSNACCLWLKKLKIDASGVWYNSIDCNQKLPSRTNHKGLNFLYAGRLIKQKGVENILESFLDLEKKYNNINLYIAGDGPEFEKYKNHYKSPNIKFLGKLNYETLLKYYAKTDIFLYPPLWPEGLPTSILEAGLMKCAVIGTSVGGNKEILKNNRNSIVVDLTKDSLKMAMEELIVDEKKRDILAKNLYKNIINNFSWDATAKKIVNDMNKK